MHEAVPGSTGDVQNRFTAQIFQQIQQKLLVSGRACLLAADVVLPYLGRLAVGVLIGQTLGRNTQRTRAINAVNHCEASARLYNISKLIA